MTVLTDDQRAVAKALFDALKQHMSNPFLEVEIRLCRFTAEPQQKGSVYRNSCGDNITDRNRLQIVDAKVTASVTAKDYESITNYLLSSMSTDSVTQSMTCDVSVNGWRYTYTTDEDGNPTRCISCVRKKRLFVKNILVPFGAYNLRFAAAAEAPGQLPVAADALHSGYTRLKERQSITDGCFRYDLTRVKEKGSVTREVEIEGVFTSGEAQLTLAWVEELVGRAITLATLPKERG